MILRKEILFITRSTTKFGLLLLLSGILFAAGCSSSKKSNCGCPNKKGMVGY